MTYLPSGPLPSHWSHIKSSLKTFMVFICPQMHNTYTHAVPWLAHCFDIKNKSDWRHICLVSEDVSRAPLKLARSSSAHKRTHTHTYTHTVAYLFVLLHGLLNSGLGTGLDSFTEAVQLIVEGLHVLLLSQLDSENTGTNFTSWQPSVFSPSSALSWDCSVWDRFSSTLSISQKLRTKKPNLRLVSLGQKSPIWDWSVWDRFSFTLSVSQSSMWDWSVWDRFSFTP